MFRTGGQFSGEECPLGTLESIGRPEDLGRVIISLPSPPTPLGPIPNLQEVIQMMERRRRQMEEELTPSPEPMIPRFPHHRHHSQHRDAGDGRRFSAGSGTLPGGQCHTGEKDRDAIFFAHRRPAAPALHQLPPPPPGEFWSLGHRDLLSPLVVF